MQSGYYYSHCPECGLPASGGFTCGHTPKVASATPLDTKTVEDGMSDEQTMRHHKFVPALGSDHVTCIFRDKDFICCGLGDNPRHQLPKPEDGIEAKQGACSCGYPIVGCDVDDGGERREDCKRAIKLELKGEGGDLDSPEERIGDHVICPEHGPKFGFCEECLESPEELPPLDDVAKQEIYEAKDSAFRTDDLYSELDKVRAILHCRERQLKQYMAENKRLRPSADVPVEERTLSVEVRKQLWLTHGCEMACLYGDDGEMQCGRFFPSLDFWRDSEAAILEGIQVHNQRRWDETQAKPVPERTAEMERLFKKVIMATYDLWDSDQDSKVGKRLRALAGLLPGYDRDIDTLLDHIEGKAK